MLSKPPSFIPHINSPSCREITQTSGSTFLLSFRFLSREKAKALSKIYAFFRILDDCVDDVSDPTLKQVSLSYWQEETQAMIAGRAQHPVMKEIDDVVKKYAIPSDYLLGLIRGCQMDLDKNRYESFSDLSDYCYHVAGLVGLTCMKIFGYQSPTSEQMAIDLGLALQLTNIIRDIKADLAMDRIYVPRDLLKKYGYSESELLNGITNSPFTQVMEELYQKALHHYNAAWPEFAKDQHHQLKAALAMGKIYRALLEKIAQNHFPVFTRKIALTKIEKIKIMVPLLLKKSA
jgi:phytoene synthase